MQSGAHEFKPWLHDWYGNPDLEILQHLLMTVEVFLAREAHDLQNRFEEELRKSTSDESHSMELAGDENWLINEVFPNILRSSLLVAFVSCVETNLAKTCKKLSRTTQFSNLKAPPDKMTIDQCGEYLKKTVRIPFPDGTQAWREIAFYRKLRNRIVHGEARVDKRMKDYKDLMRWIKGKSSLRIDSLGRVILEKAFLLEVHDTMEQFYKDFYDAIKTI